MQEKQLRASRGNPGRSLCGTRLWPRRLMKGMLEDMDSLGSLGSMNSVQTCISPKLRQRMSTYIDAADVCMYVCMYACMYVCMYVFIYVCMFIYMYVCTCIYIYIYDLVCIFVCIRLTCI